MATHSSCDAVSMPAAQAAIPFVSSSTAVVSRVGILGFMLAMTGLTYVKETGFFQSIQQGFWMHLYHFARDHYYQCLLVSLVLALAMTALPVAPGDFRRPRKGLLIAIWFVFGLNCFLLTANNGLNLLQGRPLHCQHQGIGW